MWSTLSTLQSYGTQLIESTETYAKELAKVTTASDDDAAVPAPPFDGIMSNSTHTHTSTGNNSATSIGSAATVAAAATSPPSLRSDPSSPTTSTPVTRPTPPHATRPSPSTPSAVDGADTSVELLRRENERLSATLDALKVKAKDRIQQLQATVTTLTAQLAARDEAAVDGGVVPAATTDDTEVLEALRRQLQDTASTLSAREQQLSRLMGELAAKDNLLQAALEDNKEHNGAGDKEGELKRQISDLQQQLEAYEGQLVRLQQAHSQETASAQVALQNALAQKRELLDQLAAVESSLRHQSATHSQAIATLQTCLSDMEAKVAVAEAAKQDHAAQVAGYERQIAELHRTTAVIRAKDAELAKKAAALESLTARCNELSAAAATHESALFDVEVRFQQAVQQLESVQARLADTEMRLQQSVDSAHTAHDTLRQLEQQLEDARRREEAGRADATALERALTESRAALASVTAERDAALLTATQTEQSEAAVQQLHHDAELQAAEMDALRRELDARSDTVHSQQLKLDEAAGAQAEMVARYEQEAAQLRHDHSSLQQASRAATTELSNMRSQLGDALSRCALLQTELERTAAGSQTELDRLRAELLAERRQHTDTVGQLRASLAAANEAKVAAEQALTAAQQATAASASHHQQHTQPPSPAAIERWKLEWTEKYQLVERENLRLRERSLRTEQLLAQLQQQQQYRQSRPLSATAISSTWRADTDSAAAVMADVTVLPWLDEKLEDGDDANFIGDDRGESGLSSPSRQRSSAARRQVPVAVANAWPAIRRSLRAGIRALDVQSVRVGQWLKRRPAMRLGWIVYLVALHAMVLLWLLFTRSSHQSPPANID